MIVVFSFPMSLPVAPPFLGGPFGMVLAILGIYLAIGRRPWLPGFLSERAISTSVFSAFVHKLIGAARFLESFLRPRILVLTASAWIRRFHAVYVLCMALLLALPVPLPVPFSNTVVALPIFLTGLGLLERDGLFITLGYAAAIPCIIYYGAIVWLGQEGIGFLLLHFGL